MNYLSQSEDEEEVSEELNIKFYKNWQFWSDFNFVFSRQTKRRNNAFAW